MDAGKTDVPSKGCIKVGQDLKTLEGINFPPGITTLDVSYNLLTSLVGCPSTVTDLYCYNNRLPNFVGAPAGLIRIDAHLNPIRSTKGLEQCTKLKEVSMYMCEMEELRGVPDSVEDLNVAKNKITKIVQIPKECKALGITCNRLEDDFVDKSVDQLREMLEKKMKLES